MKIIGALMLAASFGAQADQCGQGDEPWNVYGQTQFNANTAYDNPSSNQTPILGSAYLPFTVPEGKNLILDAYGVEAYDSSGIMVIFGWLGSVAGMTTAQASAHRAANGLPSVGANNGSNEFTGIGYQIPAGQIVNFRIINGSSYSGVYGWYATGCLKAAQ